jgi:hypothetical protein
VVRMMRNAPLGLATLIVCCVALLAVTSPADAAEPPNQNDPCASGGRNVCGTSDVGFYERYRYGVRWFGDYKRAVPGVAHTFCIDLRFWYPGVAYRYREFQAGPRLRNKDGRRVSIRNQRKMAYAMWTYGRSNRPLQQAAVMLYVHALMGDAAPGEVDPRELDDPRLTALYNRVSDRAAKFHGPYRIQAKLPRRMTVGRPVSGTVRVISATGRAVPGVRLRLSGIRGVPAAVRTNGAGVARVRFTPAKAGEVRLRVRTEALPSTLPRLFRPTRGASARNGQRLAASASQRRATTLVRTVAPAKVKVTTRALPQKLLVGAVTRDRVTFAGVPSTWRAPVKVEIFGPFRSRSAIRCDGPAAWTGTFTGRPGVVRTPRTRMSRPGIYTYRLVVPDGDDVVGTTTPCGVPAETFRVETQPEVTTVVSADRIEPGGELFDTLTVSGLNGESVLVGVRLYGPFATREAINCEGDPVWTGTVAATGDGEYRTDPVTLETPGFYTYVESIAKTGFVRRQAAACGEATETSVVVGRPRIRTRVSKQLVRPGATVTDTVVVSGLGVLQAPVRVELWGPFPTREAINCEGTPAHTETFTANGDGTYTTRRVRLNVAGYYTYREFIDGALQTAATATECGEVAETTLVRAVPRVTTRVSKEAVRPGGRIFDRVRVSGLGGTPGQVRLSLYGPFASKAALRCTGRPVWTGTVNVRGDGTYRSRTVKLSRAGFYTYREQIVGSPVIQAPKPRCAAVGETSLARPLILTGRGDPATASAAGRAAGPRPTRISIAGLRINAPVAPSVINLRQAALGVPVNVTRTGWWRDGAAPGDRAGTVLIAGHIDSARQGAGAFFRLKNASRADRVQVRSSDGRTRTYRVVSVRRYLKERLPPGVFTTRGRHRLVLATCGGPFVRSEGAYRDNIVVTAVPV